MKGKEPSAHCVVSVARGKPCATEFGGKKGSGQGLSVVEGVKKRLSSGRGPGRTQNAGSDAQKPGERDLTDLVQAQCRRPPQGRGS